MASPLLKVNGRDLSQYLRVQEDLDPADPDYAEPQFSGSPAFTEGAEFTADAVANREWTIPLLLDADSRPELHQLIQDINQDLFRGAEVQFAVDPDVDQISFFDLERGRLDVQFEYMLSVHSTTRATLRLWTRPYAHTGTVRNLIPSAVGTGVIERVATGILGDRPALANLWVRTGSHFKSGSPAYLVAWGITPNASHVAMVHTTQTQTGPDAGFVISGASGALGSQFKGYMHDTTLISQSRSAFELLRFRATAQTGPHRVFAVLRSRVHPATQARFSAHLRVGGPIDSFGPAVGPTYIPSSNDTRWQIADFGVVDIPTTLRGAPTWRPEIGIKAGWPSNAAASVLASPPFQFQALILLPLELGAGAVVWPPTSIDEAVTSQVNIRARSVPEERTLLQALDEQVNVSLTKLVLGGPPRLRPTGSPVATGPGHLVVFAGHPNDYHGNDVIETNLEIRERFSFLR